MDTSKLKAIGFRALRTVAQTAVAIIPVEAVGLHTVNWLTVLSGALLAGLLSVLTSIATGLPEVTDDLHKTITTTDTED